MKLLRVSPSQSEPASPVTFHIMAQSTAKETAINPQTSISRNHFWVKENRSRNARTIQSRFAIPAIHQVIVDCQCRNYRFAKGSGYYVVIRKGNRFQTVMTKRSTQILSEPKP
jgi:hypothetical protein